MADQQTSPESFFIKLDEALEQGKINHCALVMKSSLMSSKGLAVEPLMKSAKNKIEMSEPQDSVFGRFVEVKITLENGELLTFNQYFSCALFKPTVAAVEVMIDDIKRTYHENAFVKFFESGANISVAGETVTLTSDDQIKKFKIGKGGIRKDLVLEAFNARMSA